MIKKIPLLAFTLLLLCAGVSKAQLTILTNFETTSSTGSFVISGNVLYGVTVGGGTNNSGTVFSIHTDGTNYTNLYNFADTGSKAFHCSGGRPYGSLTLLGNTLFGITSLGGLHGEGTAFSIHTNGSNFRDLIDFDDTGAVSGNWGPEISFGSFAAVGHKLYAMGVHGGKNNYGNIFSIDTSYSIDSSRKGYKDLWDFNYSSDSNGARPGEGPLAVSANGKVLYGMTHEGGKNGEGNVFSIDTNGKHYKDLHDFKYNGQDGAYPDGSVILSGGKLYGMTVNSGGYYDGTIFTVDTAGHNYKQLLIFNNGQNGSNPYGNLSISGNRLYGMTSRGGFDGDGVLFTIDTAGNTYKDFYDFDYYNTGEDGYGSLLLSGTTLYGMNHYGGNYNRGIAFSYDVCNVLDVKHDSTPDNGTSNGTATAIASYGPLPFTYLWSDGQTNATATGLSAGTYVVTVTDGNGCMNTTKVIVNATSGINTISANSGIIVYPNPNNGSFTIALSGTTDKSTVEVYNTMGQQVYTGALALGNNTVELNTKANGVYLYRIISNTGNLVGQGKLVIQK